MPLITKLFRQLILLPCRLYGFATNDIRYLSYQDLIGGNVTVFEQDILVRNLATITYLYGGLNALYKISTQPIGDVMKSTIDTLSNRWNLDEDGVTTLLTSQVKLIDFVDSQITKFQSDVKSYIEYHEYKAVGTRIDNIEKMYENIKRLVDERLEHPINSILNDPLSCSALATTVYPMLNLYYLQRCMLVGKEKADSEMSAQLDYISDSAFTLWDNIQSIHASIKHHLYGIGQVTEE